MNSVMTGQNTADTVFGIHTKVGQQPGTFFIGTKPVLIAGNDLIIEDKLFIYLFYYVIVLSAQKF